MYQKILVPVDGSEASARGLAEAMKLAREQGATIRLIHVVNELMVVASYEGTIYSGELINALRESGKKLLDQAQQRVTAAGIKVEAELLEAHGGQAGQVIVKDAEQCHADIIVLGTHGRRGLSRLVMGSDAEQVVRQARVPVLLVRNLTE
ncbi:MAG: universal stress protein [Steroidobacteraceae bacterium]